MRLLLITALCFSAISATGQPLSRPDIAALNERAYTIYSRDFAAADSIFRRAAAVADEQGWAAEAAGAYLHLGVVNFLAGNYQEALPLYQTALSTFETLGDEAGQAAVLVEMGNFFKKRKELERAGEMLGRAAKLAERAGDERLLSNALDIRALMEQQAGNVGTARELYDRVLSIRRRIRDTVGLSYVYDHLASLEVAQGRIAPALAYLDSTIAIRTLLDDRQGRAIAVNNQGEALLVAGDTLGAIPYLERSLAESTAVGFTDLRQWTQNLLAASYAAVGDPWKALALQRSVQTLKDSLYDVASARRVAELQEQFEAERRERDLALERARVRTRTAWLVAAGLGILLLLALLFYLARHLRARQKMLRREAEDRLRNDRLRISRDLHDHLGAELSIVASKLGRLDRELPGEPLRPVTEQVRYAIEQMRETIWAVRLEDATYADLFARLRTFAAKLPHDGIRLELAPSLADVPLDPPRVLHLYRFAQEALANAVKHAAADRIIVAADPDSFIVTDDGTGYDATTVTRGYGLSSLRERAAEIGGRLEVTSAPGKGTTVLLHLNTQTIV